MSDEFRLDLCEGKYTYIRAPGVHKALRYGEEWRDFIGDKFVYAMGDEIERLRNALHEISLCSVNSASTREEMGRIARAAILGESEALVDVDYTNWRGERRTRTIIPVSIRFGSTAWHTVPQWLLSAVDIEDGRTKEFAMASMHEWSTTK